MNTLFARGKPLSIRASLALLVTALVLPASLVMSYLLLNSYQQQREQITRDAIATARAMASTLDRDLASVESGLMVLSASPSLASDELATFYRHANAVASSQNVFNYVLVDDTGRQHLNTLRPYGAPLPVVPASTQVQQVFRSDATLVTDSFVGAVTGRPVIAVAVPVHRDGRIAYALAAGIAPDRVAALLLQQRLPPGWIGAVWDRTGTLIARTHEMARFVGKKAVAPAVDASRLAAEGAVEAVTLEGVPVVTAFSRSTMSGWTVAVGVPRAELNAGLKISFFYLLASTAILLAAGLWLAWKLGDRIANAIRSLIGPALELGFGRAVEIPAFGLKEADEVGQALIAASNLLRQAQRGAHYDELTSLPNRALFQQMLKLQLAVCARSKFDLAVLYVDLDGFKAVNDTHGHAIGDLLLRSAATRLKEGLRGSDVAARLGGDEFVVLLVQSSNEGAALVAKKLVALLSKPYFLEGLEIRISASIGIATSAGSAASGDLLLKRADAAMYEAKNTGKNSYAVAALSEIEV